MQYVSFGYKSDNRELILKQLEARIIQNIIKPLFYASAISIKSVDRLFPSRKEN